MSHSTSLRPVQEHYAYCTIEDVTSKKTDGLVVLSLLWLNLCEYHSRLMFFTLPRAGPQDVTLSWSDYDHGMLFQ